jgi:hypothetical protein
MSMTEALEMMSSRSCSFSSAVHAFALFNFFVSVSPGPRHLKTSNEPGRVALVCRIVSLRALTAFVATHFSAELVECHGAEHRDSLAEHPERHPDRPLAALASDSRITLGLELGHGAVVCHPRIKARSKRERTNLGPRSIPAAARKEAKENPVRGAGFERGKSRGPIEIQRACASAARTTPVANNGLPGSGLRNGL